MSAEKIAREEAEALSAAYAVDQRKALESLDPRMRAIFAELPAPKAAAYVLDDLEEELRAYHAVSHEVTPGGGMHEDLIYPCGNSHRVAHIDDMCVTINVPFLHAWCKFPQGKFPNVPGLGIERYRFNEINGIFTITLTESPVTLLLQPGSGPLPATFTSP